MADPRNVKSLSDAELRSQATKLRQAVERDDLTAVEPLRVLDTEAWRRFDVSHSTDLPTL